MCAIAFVKRRFPHYFEQVQADMAGGWTLRGWPVDPRTPSTLDLAAANWLARVVRDEAEPVLRRLHEAAERLPFSPGDCGVNRLRCVRDAYRAPSSELTSTAASCSPTCLKTKKSALIRRQCGR